ncbi:heme peroxidase [Xylariaceae sp. FL0804]|nr:heme peroxidase [Xylariaceae sp. FL0804]
MQATRQLILLAAAAAQLGGVALAQSCPSVWTDVAADLAPTFRADNGSCTDAARQAIRLSFHDCFPSACDGSVILANECEDRGENSQMTPVCAILRNTTDNFDVGTADLIQFGAALGLVACQDGLAIPFKVGRVDNSTANPEGQMPGANTDAATLISDFALRNLSMTDVVALVGAHSVGKNLSGDALDSTPDDLDPATFYAETKDESNPASLGSDRFLSNSTETEDTWTSMETVATWQDAFTAAMNKMVVIGQDESTLTDCSSVITSAYSS